MLLPNFYLFWPCFLQFLSHWKPQFLFRPLRPPAVLAAAGVAPFVHGGLCPAITDSKGKKYRKPVVKIHRFSVFLFFLIKYRGFMGLHGVSCFQISFSLKMGFCNFSTRNFGDRTNVEPSARVIGLSSRKMAEIEFQGCAVGVLFSQDISLIIWPAN